MFEDIKFTKHCYDNKNTHLHTIKNNSRKIIIKKRYYHIIPDASVVLQWMEKLSWERHLLQTQPCTSPTHCRWLATIFHPFSSFSENRAQRYYGKHRNPDIDFHTWERLLYIWFQISCWQATSKLITCHHISQVDPFLNDDWGNQFHTINDMISAIQWRVNSWFNAITENSRYDYLYLLFRLYLPTVKFQMIRP